METLAAAHWQAIYSTYLMPMLTVMGIFGAFGKMNFVSSNLFFERKWSARNILWCVGPEIARRTYRRKEFLTFTYHPAPLFECISEYPQGKNVRCVLPVPKAVSDYHRGGVSLYGGHYDSCFTRHREMNALARCQWQGV